MPNWQTAEVLDDSVPAAAIALLQGEDRDDVRREAELKAHGIRLGSKEGGLEPGVLVNALKTYCRLLRDQEANPAAFASGNGVGTRMRAMLLGQGMPEKDAMEYMLRVFAMLDLAGDPQLAEFNAAPSPSGVGRFASPIIFAATHCPIECPPQTTDATFDRRKLLMMARGYARQVPDWAAHDAAGWQTGKTKAG